MALSPYDELHIYYLSGRLDAGFQPFAGGYLGNWEEEDTSFLFFSRPAAEKVNALLAGQPHLNLLDSFQMTYEQWQGARIEPMQIGGFELRPPWWQGGENPPCENPRRLILDPGLVFGSGTHPTTADCLRALETAFSQNRPETTLDLGTGTGILALASASLGCRRVLAVDLNPLASATAARNVSANAMTDRILVVQGRAEALIDCPAELLVANLHYAVLEKVMAAPGFGKKPQVILSGLLRSEAKAAKERLRQRGFRIDRSWEHEQTWFTLYAVSASF
ncbi:MAG: 50S ribosomal protein L11 methyltransferase [Desulfobacterales bacterium]|nr:50S ribosomal protein L11 methyltransferase [Desulfobacterales bacterium]